MSFNEDEQNYNELLKRFEDYKLSKQRSYEVMQNEVKYLTIECRRLRREKAKLQDKCQKLIDNLHKLSGGKNV